MRTPFRVHFKGGVFGSYMTRNRKLLVAKMAAVMGTIPVLIWAYEYGPNPGYVKVPGENGGASCAAGGSCHALTAANFTTGSVAVNFPNGMTYTPGVPQQLSVTIADSDPTLKGWGFQLTARSGSPATTMAGTFTSADANTLLMCSQSNLQVFQQVNYSASGTQNCPSNEPLQYVEHSLQGFNATIGPGSATYHFNWTPPASNVGNIVIYVAGNAGIGLPANVNGDHVYTQTYTLTPAAAAPAPSIYSGGVVTAESFGGFSSIAPGTWIEIYGTNLAANTVNWSASDFQNGVAPTSLGGVTVSIGGQAAYIDYVSSGQVNAQVPSNVGTGTQNVVVTSNSVASSPYPITVSATQPGLLAPPNFQVNGTQYVVALHADGTYVLPAGAISGLTSTPAKAGETIILYGIGFGNVTPSFSAGQIVTGANTLASSFLVNFGQTAATVTCGTCYDGLAPNFVGLYQFQLVVPNVAAGNSVPFSFTLGGANGSQKLFTAVQ